MAVLVSDSAHTPVFLLTKLSRFEATYLAFCAIGLKFKSELKVQFSFGQISVPYKSLESLKGGRHE